MMDEERNIPMNWAEIDKLKLKAHWLDNHNFVVERHQRTVLRGSWQFSYTKANNWECTKAMHHLIRGGSNEVTGNPIPQDVAYFAKWFLLVAMKFTVSATTTMTAKQ